MGHQFELRGRRKTFYFDAQFQTKPQAVAHAQRVRDVGYYARLTFENGRWIVWSRVKRGVK